MYDADWVKDIQQQKKAFLTSSDAHQWLGIQHLDANKSPTKMLDYACGSGLPSQWLRPFFSESVGVDLAEVMLERFQRTGKDLGLSSDQWWAIRGDLFSSVDSPALRSDKLYGFDLVVIAWALHHCEDVQLAVTRLAERLRPGGVLLIVDWASIESKDPDGFSGGHGHHHHHHHHHGHRVAVSPNHETENDREHTHAHAAAHTISHNSFSEDMIHKLYKDAGCVKPSYRLADQESTTPRGTERLFYSRAEKAVA